MPRLGALGETGKDGDKNNLGAAQEEAVEQASLPSLGALGETGKDGDKNLGAAQEEAAEQASLPSPALVASGPTLSSAGQV